MKRAFGMIVVAAMLAASGCEGNVSTEEPQVEVANTAPAPPAPEPAGGTESAEPSETGEASAPAEAPAEPPAEAPAEPAAPDGTTVKAEVGAGVKGKDYGGPGFVTTPVAEYFRTGERIAFDIQIPSAMKLYKAAHNDKGPKTHEEFMNIIITEGAVQLPELPMGEEYVYDPKTEQLLVRKPGK